jgi:hypothetical protein
MVFTTGRPVLTTRSALHPLRGASAQGVLGAALLVLFLALPAAGQSLGGGLDAPARQTMDLLCLKHSIQPQAACEGLAALAATSAALPNTGDGMLDSLFDPHYEADQLRELAQTYDLPASRLAAALFDYRLWELTRSPAPR